MEKNIKGVRVSYGLILKADIETIEAIQGYVDDLPGATVIYQTTEAGRKLYIKRGGDGP